MDQGGIEEGGVGHSWMGPCLMNVPQGQRPDGTELTMHTNTPPLSGLTFDFKPSHTRKNTSAFYKGRMWPLKLKTTSSTIKMLCCKYHMVE